MLRVFLREIGSLLINNLHADVLYSPYSTEYQGECFMRALLLAIATAGMAILLATPSLARSPRAERCC